MTIEAMKQALEAFEHMCHHTRAKVGYKGEMVGDAMESLRQAIAEEEKQKPVAWRGYNWGHSPDDWVYRDFDNPILDGNGNNVGQPLYTHPQPRKWVGLTDEEIKGITLSSGGSIFSAIMFTYEKLKEKNNV